MSLGVPEDAASVLEQFIHDGTSTLSLFHSLANSSTIWTDRDVQWQTLLPR